METRLVILCLFSGIAELFVDGASPVFNTGLQSSYSFPESTGTGLSVASVVFTDADPADTLSIDMVINTYFSFTDNGDKTGTVKTHASTTLVGASGTTQTLTFIARDSTFATVTGSYNITVTNVAPTLSDLPTSIQLSEDTSLETLVYNITCTDPVDTVHSSLLSVTPSNSPKQEFFFVRIIPTTTIYGVYARAQSDKSQGTFNYNSQRDYAIVVQCTDQKDPVNSILTVNLQQNNAPVITTPNLSATQSVASTTTAGTVVYTLTATDAENDVITYNFAVTPASSLFHVFSSGAVQAKVDLSSVSLSSSYILTITPLDVKNTGSSVTLTLVITGANNAPTLTNLNSAVSVNENTATGTSIFQVTVMDSDVGDTHTLLMSVNPASGTSLFTLDASKNIKTLSALNYETITDKEYQLYISVSDGTATTTGTLTVTLANLNEKPAWTAATYRADIAEGSAVGTSVNSGLNTTDPDTGDTLTCYMSCVLAGYFSMSTNCNITVSSVYSLDAGLANTVTCTINGVDTGGNTATTTLIIDIVDSNNYTPTFAPTSYSYTVTGYEAINTTLGTVTATDGDSGTYGDISYSLNQSAFSGTVLNINATSGLISTAVSMENCNCTGTTWSISVYVTDKGGLVGTAVVQLAVGVTTTLSTTTTTDRNRTFLEDPSNAAWFSILLVALVIGLFVTGFVLITQVFDKPRCICQKRPRPRRLHDRHGDLPMRKPAVSVRNFPPPDHAQSWRNTPRFY